MDIATIGDNSGGVDIATQVRDNLAEKFRDLAKRAAELAGMLERAPTKVDTEDEANKVSEAVRQCSSFEKAAEGARIEAKEPYLTAGRSVDAYFKNMADPVGKTKAALLRVRTDYDIRVEAEQRRLREEQARRDREEADRLAQEAKNAAGRDAAAVAESRAQETQQATLVKPAELTRTRTDSGVLSSLRSEWRHEVVDAKKVPKKFMAPSDQLIRAAVKTAVTSDGRCPLEIPGVRIYEHKFSQVR